MGYVTEQAEVVAVDAGRVWVQVCARQGCSSCSLAGACGQGLVARWLKKSPPILEINDSRSFKRGDQVELGVQASQLTAAAWQLFALPLMGLLIFALLAEFVGITQVLIQLLLACCGLGLGLLVAQKLASPAEIIIVRNLTANPVVES